MKIKIVSILIVILEIMIGVLGELMPDTLKISIQNFCVQTFGIPYYMVWIIFIAITVILLLFLISREKKSEVNKPQIQNGGTIININRIENATFNDQKQLTKPLSKRLKYMVGEKTYFKDIFNRLRRNSLILYGTGGIGKTTCAKIIVGEYGNYFKQKEWLDAQLGLEIDINKLILNKLQTIESPCLLVIDNLLPKDITVLREYSEKLSNWTFLVTTRGDLDCAGFDKIQIKVSERTALKLFLFYYFDKSNYSRFKQFSLKLLNNVKPEKSPFTEKELNLFFAEIGNHTLAIELIAHTLKNDKSLSLAAIREKMKQHEFDRIQLIPIETGYLSNNDLTRQERTAFNYLLAAFKNSKDLLESEKILLKNLAVLPTFVWEKQTWLHLWPDNIDFKIAENNLITYGWLEIQKVQEKSWTFFRRATLQNEYYSLHPLVKQLLHYELQPWLFEECKSLLNFLVEKIRENYNIYENYLLETIANLIQRKLIVENNENWAAFLFELADFYSDNKRNYELELTCLAKASDIYNATVNRYEEARCYRCLGDVYQEQGDMNKALEYFEKSNLLFEELYRDNLRSESFKNRLAISYGKLGEIYQAQGDMKKALDYFEKFTQLFEELYSDNTSSESLKNGLAISYEKLGDIYQDQGEMAKALDYFERKLILNSELYESNPKWEKNKNDMAISYSSLGGIYRAQGEMAKALDYFEKSTQLFKELYCDNPHRESLKNGLAISYSRLGEIYQAKSDMAKALDYFEKYNKLNEELYHDNPRSESLKNGLAISYSKLGEIYQAQGDMAKAVDYFKKYNKLTEELYRDNPRSIELYKNMGISYYKLADIYAQFNKKKEAIDYYQKMVEIFGNIYDLTKIEFYKKWKEKVEGEIEKLK